MLAGGNPVLFPVLKILDTQDQRPLLDVVGRLDEFDLAIFISPNAVNKAMGLIHTKRTLPPKIESRGGWPGHGTGARNFGVNKVIAPTYVSTAKHCSIWRNCSRSRASVS